MGQGQGRGRRGEVEGESIIGVGGGAVCDERDNSESITRASERYLTGNGCREEGRKGEGGNGRRTRGERCISHRSSGNSNPRDDSQRKPGNDERTSTLPHPPPLPNNLTSIYSPFPQCQCQLPSHNALGAALLA